MRQLVGPPARLEGAVLLPGDKSISHRALLLNSLARGTAHVSNLCHGDDRVSMLRCLRGLGTRIDRHTDCAITGATECFNVRGRGHGGFDEPSVVLNAGNSGTTLRLVAGLLAAQPFFSVISGDRSLRARPMGRIVRPLTEMGARVSGRMEDSLAPLAIRGGGLRGIVHETAESSAQVKSAILIAGLHAKGKTTIRQPSASRDHTERMMIAMGAELATDGREATLMPSDLRSMDVRVPGDISGSAFWLVAAACHPNARISLPGVGINPTRTGVLEVLREMGARIRVENVKEEAGEPSADLVAESSDLSAVEISGDIIPRVIDEIPVLALAACFASGTTVIKDAAELRVKESDRISATVDGLSRLGARVEERPDGMVIEGGSILRGAECDSFGDHRIAMTMGIAGLLAKGETTVDGGEAAAVSYPGFWQTLNDLAQRP
ncbi:MAG: 3-phosphoshikimate 1-carboxyvinyltransferase [Chloroflexi bacterium]|nr:3-phosphoshikimate 1-carboxyvinyltransferase [Chloroflexota bacterium]